MKKVRFFYVKYSVLFLFVGVFIYIIFRDISHLSFFERMNLPEFINKKYMEIKPSFLNYTLKYNFPDMFWFLSGILLLRFIWFNNKKEMNIYIFCFYLTGITFELCQLFKYIPGTFDILDLFFMGLGAFIEGLLNKYFIFEGVKDEED